MAQAVAEPGLDRAPGQNLELPSSGAWTRRGGAGRQLHGGRASGGTRQHSTGQQPSAGAGGAAPPRRRTSRPVKDRLGTNGTLRGSLRGAGLVRQAGPPANRRRSVAARVLPQRARGQGSSVRSMRSFRLHLLAGSRGHHGPGKMGQLCTGLYLYPGLVGNLYVSSWD